MTSPALAYGLAASALALPAGLLLLWGLGARGLPLGGWAGLGWLLASVAGVGTGTWAASKHGRPGTAFFLAAFAGIALRASVVGIALAAWLRGGGEAAVLYLVGAAAGLVPQWGFEILWFARRGRVLRRASPEDRS